ncbi:MAG: glycosyltransferase [Candidatus Odinarchaeota archaeon]
MESPFVAVFMVTYNHEKYIGKAIESVLMQHTTFSVRLYIGEDCSKDKTLEICTFYVNENPGKIELIHNNVNLGPIKNALNIFKKCFDSGSKYIAMLEGDDYWIDSLKLQKQVDFLEGHSDFSLCFHDAIILHNNKLKQPKYFCPLNQKDISNIYDIINNNWFIPSASIVLRSNYIFPLPNWYKDIHNGDYALLLLLANKGRIRYLNEVMSIYRKSGSSLSDGIGKKHISINNKMINLLTYFNDYTELKYQNHIKNRIFKLNQENKYLSRRKIFPLYKYLNKRIWIQKTINMLNDILLKSENEF